ncbi:MAG: DUF4412 domain-containing protein [Gemmatimonadaceae bacterium]
MYALRLSPVRLALSFGLVAGSVLISTSASAQLGGLRKRASDAVERKANQKIDQKIDAAAQKLVDKSFDSAFGAIDTGNGSSDNGKSGGSSRIFAMLPNAPTEDHYDFDVVFTYEIENMPKGKPSPDDKGLMVMHFNSEGKYTGARIASAASKKDDSELFAIFDVKNESMVMLMTSDKKEKASMAYSWKDAKQYSAAQTPASGNVVTSGQAGNTSAVKPMTFSSLGKKTIAGYSADGYKGENEDGEVEVWVSKDPKLSYGRMMGASSSMKQMRGVMPGSYPAGMLLEVTSTDRKSGDKGRMTVKSIDTKANVHVNMSDYPRIGATK